MAVTLGPHNTQVALSSEEQKEVLLRLRRDLRSIQEALRVVTTAMGFLAGEGGRLDMPLSQYLLKVLRLRKTEFCGRVLLVSVFMPITCTEVLHCLVKLLQIFFFFSVYPAAHSVPLGNSCTGESADALAQWNGSTLFLLCDMQFDLGDFVYCYYARFLLMAMIKPW